MRALGLLLVALIFAGCGEHAFDGPVFTPKPGDYPCHHEDGSAAPDWVSCRPYDGTPTCCPSRERCVPDGCEYEGPEMWARKRVARLPERP